MNLPVLTATTTNQCTSTDPIWKWFDTVSSVQGKVDLVQEFLKTSVTVKKQSFDSKLLTGVVTVVALCLTRLT